MLLLLHGALGAASDFEALLTRLSPSLNPQPLTFPGHGTAASDPEPYSLRSFAEFLVRELDSRGVEKADIFGYSMGGAVALVLARHHPERVGRIMTLATKRAWTPEVAARETRMLDPEAILAKVPRFAEALATRHGEEHWRDVLSRTAAMMTALGNQDELPLEEYAQIPHHVRMSVGDKDMMVTVEETAEGSRALQQGELLVLPRTVHPLERVDPARLAWEIENFFTQG